MLDERAVADDDDTALAGIGILTGAGTTRTAGTAGRLRGACRLRNEHAAEGAAAALGDGSDGLAANFWRIHIREPRRFGQEQPLERALPALAEIRIQRDREARVAGDSSGGLSGAAEVARVERVPALGGQVARDRFRLAQSQLGQRRILLPLDAALQVPGALAMPHQTQQRLDLRAHYREGRYCTPEGPREMLGIKF